MTINNIRNIDDARAFYRQDEFGQPTQPDMPETIWRIVAMLTLLVIVIAAPAWLMTSCAATAENAQTPEAAALQAAIDTQCTTGTNEQRLSCAIDVAQGHGHGMTPEEYARAKQAAALLGAAK